MPPCTFALNVCLVPRPPCVIDHIAVLASTVCHMRDAPTALHYRVHSSGGPPMPHITVCQLFASVNRIPDIVAALGPHVSAARAMSPTVTTLYVDERLELGPQFAAYDGHAVHLPAIAVRADPWLTEFQMNVSAAMAPFHVPAEASSNGFVGGWANDASVEWARHYLQRHADGSMTYFPHITLGSASTDASLPNVPEQLRDPIALSDCDLVVARMGNYCSCGEVLHVL